jgi:tRNA A-37 threonylcarbamoyl transferase component Bud32
MTGPRYAAAVGGDCLDEGMVVAQVFGDGDRIPAGRLEHLADCQRCRILAAEAARAITESDAEGKAAAVQTPAGQMVTTLEIGEVLLSRYQIVRFIAGGGMGEVYAARDRLLNEEVALKTLRCASLDDAEAAKRLKVEVSLSRRVTHCNVCRIFDYGLHENSIKDGSAVPFFTMELLHGRTLSQRLAAEGALSMEETRALLLAILDGLEAIHRAGIVHRDLKSDNVFLVRDSGQREYPVIMDFGLARAPALDGLRSSTDGRVVGTLDYMPPEQLAGRSPTASFDIYALGVVLFQVLSGRKPFADRNSIANVLQRAQQPAPLVSTVAPDAGRDWDRIVARCLDRDPARRFGSVSELRAALGRRGLRLLGRRGWVVAAAGAATLAGAVVTALGGSAPGQQTVMVPRGAPASPSAASAAVWTLSVPPAALAASVRLPSFRSAGKDPPRTRRRQAISVNMEEPPVAPVPPPEPTVPASTEPQRPLLAPATRRGAHPDDVIDPFR